MFSQMAELTCCAEWCQETPHLLSQWKNSEKGHPCKQTDDQLRAVRVAVFETTNIIHKENLPLSQVTDCQTLTESIQSLEFNFTRTSMEIKALNALNLFGSTKLYIF